MWGLETIAAIATIAGTAVTIVAAAITFLIARGGKQFARPSLRVSVAHTDIKRDTLARTDKARPVSMVIYGAEIPEDGELYVIFEVLLENNGKVPITNITVGLSYPASHGVRDFSFLDAQRQGIEFSNEGRDIKTLRSMANVTIAIPILTPGTKLLAPDTIRFTRRSEASAREAVNADVEPLRNRLQAIEGFGDFFVLDVTVFSAQCAPISQRINVMWFVTSDMQKLLGLLAKIRKAIWAGTYVRSGFYLLPFRLKPFLRREAGELRIPKLHHAISKKGDLLALAVPLENQYARLRFTVPTWNYYGDGQPPVEEVYLAGLSRFVAKLTTRSAKPRRVSQPPKKRG